MKVQRQRDKIALQQAEEKVHLAAARLAQILRLDPVIELRPHDSQLLPLSLISTAAPAGALVEQALAARPEAKENAALVVAARVAKNGAVYGPLIPSLGGQAFVGGIGGGKDSQTGNFGESEEYIALLNWRIGPGGLFDFGEIHAQQARVRATRAERAKGPRRNRSAGRDRSRARLVTGSSTRDGPAVTLRCERKFAPRPRA